MNRAVLKRRSCCRGFIITDMVIGISLLGVLLAIISIATSTDLRTKRAASAHRQLTFAAESALHGLTPRQGESTTTLSTDDGVEVRLTLLPDTPAPDGYVWAKAAAEQGGQSVELYGLVQSAKKQGAAQ